MNKIDYQALRYGDNVLWFLNELAAYDASDIDGGEFDVYGEDRNGLEGCSTIDVTELAADAAKLIEAAEKRIAELEKSEEQLFNEREHAESALADMYFAATGDRPEWSNWFGFSDAVDAVVDRIADLEAKQPSPVVPAALPENDDEDGHDIDYLEPSEVYALGRTAGWNACRAAMLQGKGE